MPRRTTPRDKTDLNRTAAVPQETQNHDPQDTQDANIIHMDLLQQINNISDNVNELRWSCKFKNRHAWSEYH